MDGLKLNKRGLEIISTLGDQVGNLSRKFREIGLNGRLREEDMETVNKSVEEFLKTFKRLQNGR